MIGWAPCPSPWSGSIANCITLVRIVIAPTAISPPYFWRELLKHTEITLSLACMINVATPRARQGRMIFGVSPRFFFLIFRNVLFPHRKLTTQIQESAWEMIVASAAPFTSISRPKIKIGSRMIFATAPISTESIPVFANPWAVINAFIPRVISTKIVPRA